MLAGVLRVSVAVALVLSATRAAHAQGASASPSGASAASKTTSTAADDRGIGGHIFLTPAGFEPTFVTAHLGLSLSTDYASFAFPNPRKKGLYRLALAGLRQEFDVGVRLHERVGLVGSLGAAVFAGVDSDSVFNVGGDAALLWSVGLAGVIVRVPRTLTQVGARLTVHGSYGGRVVALAGVLDDAVKLGKSPTEDDVFLKPSDATIRLSWTVAQGIWKYFTAQAALGWATTLASQEADPNASASATTDITLGVAVAADGSRWVPVALQLECDFDGRIAAGPAGDADASALLSDGGTSFFSAGVYYVGRRELMLGALAGTRTHYGQASHSTLNVQFDLRYFF